MKAKVALIAALVAWAASAPLRAQPLITGVDGYTGQGTVDWAAASTAGVKFAFMKATQGVTIFDSQFNRNMQQAAANGVLIGPYHFCNLDTDSTNPDDAINEANRYLDVIKPYYDNGLYLPPVADVEGFPVFNSNAEGQAFTSAWVQKFSDRINAVLGVRPIIYTSLSKATGAESRYTAAISSTHKLWLAQWKGTGTTNPPKASDTPNWGIWQFWQWTDSFAVNGFSSENPDGDVYGGTLAQLQALRVGTPRAVTSISNFNDDEGYFHWDTSYSGSNQGILDDAHGGHSTAGRVTSTTHWGAGSEKIFIDTNASSWVERFVSGLATSAASPAGNYHVPATGSIGFWLKTTDSGVTTQILIDDKADNSSIEGGVIKNVIADGAWHLYEWSLPDAAQWNNFSGGDGAITESVVTIDAIRLAGTHDSTIYLDDVTHNPTGSLVPPAGDVNGDCTVDEKDLNDWKSDLGTTVNDFDFLAWQRSADLSAAGTPLANAVPEPAAMLLLTVSFAAFERIRSRCRHLTLSF